MGTAFQFEGGYSGFTSNIRNISIAQRTNGWLFAVPASTIIAGTPPRTASFLAGVSPVQYLRSCAAVLIGLIGATSAKAAPLDVELEDLRPGLPAVYRSLTDRDATLARVDLKPAFNLGHSSVHPRIPPGPFEATWSGIIF